MSTTADAAPRARNADATRTALLEAATKRFTLLGYERTTTRDIAADAGVNVSLIARYFGSKEGLFAEVLRESSDALDRLRERDDGDFVTSVVDGLQPGRWPEFGGEHPLALLLSGNDDDTAAPLRRRSLDKITQYLGERVSSVGNADVTGDTALRGDVMLAVVIGMLTVRSARPHGALGEADDEQLRRVTERLVAAVASLD